MNRQEANELRRKYAGDHPGIVERINLLERQERELKTADGERRAELKRLIGRTITELQAAISSHCGETQ